MQGYSRIFKDMQEYAGAALGKAGVFGRDGRIFSRNFPYNVSTTVYGVDFMNQKLEDQLQLALATSEEDRARTEDLNVGFDRETKRWELIVKYHGSLAGLEELGVTVERLLAGYAVLTVPEGLVERIAELPEIEYVEKPKRFFYDAVGPTEDSCVIQVTGRAPFLT